MSKIANARELNNEYDSVPNHVSIIMDGNGRWAYQKGLPRTEGHREGLQRVKQIVKICPNLGINILTIFAFSSENWKRPSDEVDYLLELFLQVLEDEVSELHERGVSLRFIGNLNAFPTSLRKKMDSVERATTGNKALVLNVAVNYGGKWDMVQAVRSICKGVKNGEKSLSSIDESLLSNHLCLSDFPDPDLLIRTGGEKRLSNYLLWQLAYTELYFTDVYWPDFGVENFKAAVESFSKRERRFGMTSDQISSGRLPS